MFSTDFIFRQQENFVDNQKCWAGFRPLCNKILFFTLWLQKPIFSKNSMLESSLSYFFFFVFV